MLQRKRFTPQADVQRHRRLQQDLPEHLKMRVVIASHGGNPCAGAIYSALGDTAVYLFGATDDLGMRTCASYQVQWEIVRSLKQAGVNGYDLNGADPALNAGTYHFKRGLAGKRGAEVTFAPHFQAVHASLVNQTLLLVDRARLALRTVRSRRGALERTQ
jgi:lipid II:glycine glycyltransferase (peptidoglycan interpeptide bridge formation enzyme)